MYIMGTYISISFAPHPIADHIIRQRTLLTDEFVCLRQPIVRLNNLRASSIQYFFLLIEINYLSGIQSICPDNTELSLNHWTLCVSIQKVSLRCLTTFFLLLDFVK